MMMGPQMNANTRKCKTHQFVCVACSGVIELLDSSGGTRTQEKTISVHLRLLADFK
jgi:hypothetical protein